MLSRSAKARKLSGSGEREAMEEERSTVISIKQPWQAALLAELAQSLPQLKYVKLGYSYALQQQWALYLLLLLAAAAATAVQLLPHSQQLVNELGLWPLAWAAAFLAAMAALYFSVRRRRVYLVDFACYKPDDKYSCSFEQLEKFAVNSGKYTKESLEFQYKVTARSGLGPETYVPAFVFGKEAGTEPCMATARREAEDVMFGAIDELLAKTGVRPRDIGVLVVNCSIFNPTPSLSAMVVNRYKLRGNVRSFSLGGMGCSAGLIAVDLAADMLRLHGGGADHALVVSMENITQNWYVGNDRSMLVTNCLFRIGGAAALLSSQRRAGQRRTAAKYELLHLVRSHRGADDDAFGCVQQREDAQGLLGVSLDKRLMAVAAQALAANISTLGPLVLPLTEQLRYAIDVLHRRLGRRTGKKPYVPDFRRAFQHVCIHAGGRAVLDEVSRSLRLTAEDMEPARCTLHRFGNTSSSSLWYELAYAEAKGRVRRGDRVWQLAFGSGFKCNSAVWRALADVPVPLRYNPWLSCIRRYPAAAFVPCEVHLRSPTPSAGDKEQHERKVEMAV